MASRVLGPYELERALGAGGFGAVWVGRHRETGARHALKVLELTSVDDALRFEREAEALARLGSHPGLVVVHSAFSVGNTAVLVMELIEGETLERLLARGGPLETGVACRLVGQVARAVAHAHRRGVLHRDIKPANVLIDRAGQPRLVDLGLAAISGGRSLTRTGEVLGTPAYMAPEQVTGAGCDARTDVFGLGALLHACLSGRAPRQGPPLALLAEAAQRPLPDLDALRPGLPAGLTAAVRRATAPAPAERFAGAEELADALRAMGVAGARRRGGPVLVLLGAAALVIGAGWATLGGPPEPPAPAPLPGPTTPSPALPAAPAPFDLRAARQRLLVALERDERDRSSAHPAPRTRDCLLALRRESDAGRSSPALVKLLRDEVAQRLARAEPWSREHDLLLALDTYRFYWFDQTPLLTDLPLVVPPTEGAWWRELVAARLGTARVQLKPLEGLDPELLAACPQSRILSAAAVARFLAGNEPLAAEQLVLFRRGLGLDPQALADQAAGPEGGYDAFLSSEMWRYAQAALAIRREWGGAQGARALGEAFYAGAFAASRERTERLFHPEVAARVLWEQADFLRDFGRAAGRPDLVRQATALRRERVLKHAGGHALRGQLACCEDLLAVSELEQGPAAAAARAELLSDLQALEDQVNATSEPQSGRLWNTLRAEALLATLPGAGPERQRRLHEIEDALANAVVPPGGPVAADEATLGRYGVLHVKAMLAAGNRGEARARLAASLERARSNPSWGTQPQLKRLADQLPP